jgi:hypothetical protein
MAISLSPPGSDSGGLWKNSPLAGPACLYEASDHPDKGGDLLGSKLFAILVNFISCDVQWV